MYWVVTWAELVVLVVSSHSPFLSLDLFIAFQYFLPFATCVFIVSTVCLSFKSIIEFGTIVSKILSKTLLYSLLLSSPTLTVNEPNSFPLSLIALTKALPIASAYNTPSLTLTIFSSLDTKENFSCECEGYNVPFGLYSAPIPILTKLLLNSIFSSLALSLLIFKLSTANFPCAPLLVELTLPKTNIIFLFIASLLVVPRVASYSVQSFVPLNLWTSFLSTTAFELL